MKLVGLGRLGRDIEMRTTSDGQSVGNIAIAFNYGRKGEDGKRPSEWIRASIWGARADALAPYLLKGQQVDVVLGDPHIETYEKQDGTTGFSLVARVDDIELAGSAQGASQQQAAPRQAVPQQRQAAPQQRQAAPQQRQAAPRQQQNAGSGFDDMEDDIPF